MLSAHILLWLRGRGELKCTRTFSQPTASNASTILSSAMRRSLLLSLSLQRAPLNAENIDAIRESRTQSYDVDEEGERDDDDNDDDDGDDDDGSGEDEKRPS